MYASAPAWDIDIVLRNGGGASTGRLAVMPLNPTMPTRYVFPMLGAPLCPGAPGSRRILTHAALTGVALVEPPKFT